MSKRDIIIKFILNTLENKFNIIKMSNRYFTDELIILCYYEIDEKEELYLNIGKDCFDQYPESFKKNNKSAESQKNNLSLNFFAEFEEQYRERKFEEKEILIGDNLNFENRRKKAIYIINSINKVEDELEYIEEALNFDNTNKYVIYKLLKYYYDKKDEIKFNEAVNKYKFCITKKFKLMEGDNNIIINLDNFYKINIPILEYEEDPSYQMIENNIFDLRNFVVFLFNQFYHIGKSIVQIKSFLNEKDLDKILTVRYIVLANQMFELCFEEENKEQILNKYNKINDETKKDLIPLMEKFLCKYLFSKEFENFQNNQPVSYKYNLTFFYNYIIYYFYDLVIEVDESGQKLIFKKEKLLTYINLINFHNLIFDENLDKKEPFNGTMNQLLQFLLLMSSTERKRDYFIRKNPFHLSKFDIFLDSSLADKFISKLKENYEWINIERVNDKIVIKDNENESSTQIELKYDHYSKNLLNQNEIRFIWENIQFEQFQQTNFFLKSDLKYLKYLIKVILSSNLFKEIFKTYSNISSLTEYYFKNPKNIQDYIDRIIFLPLRVSDIGKYAITDRFLLSVLVCGYPAKEINTINDYRLYRIIELSLRSIILGDHEPPHFIKSAYSIISEGKISRITSKTDKDIDSGFFLEEILFGWVQDVKKPLDLSRFKLSTKIEYNNKALLNKRIDLITAITLLNPDIYSQDLTHFRKSIYEIKREDLKNFSFDKLNPEYKSYLQSVVDEKTIRDCCNSDNIWISAAMKGEDMSIEYIQYNHNKKY